MLLVRRAGACAVPSLVYYLLLIVAVGSIVTLGVGVDAGVVVVLADILSNYVSVGQTVDIIIVVSINICTGDVVVWVNTCCTLAIFVVIRVGHYRARVGANDTVVVGTDSLG
jgi:hypothetical protein